MESLSVLDYGLAPTAALLERAFADYFVKLSFSAPSLLGLVRQDSVDLAASRVWWCDGEPAAVLLHAARGTEARLASMGVIPAARRRGVGRRAVERWIADGRAQGFRSLTLEVIRANTPAVALYDRCGFQRMQRLAGWTHSDSGAPRPPTLPRPAPTDARSVARQIAARADALALPWQISAESVAQLAPPWSAWELDGASAVVSDLAAPVVAVRGLAWSEAPGPAAVTRLLQALVLAHPGREWQASAKYPASWSEIFSGAGWTPSPIDQWHLRLALG